MTVSINFSAQDRSYYLFENNIGKFSFKCPAKWTFISDSLTNQGEYPNNKKELLTGRFISIDSIEAAEYDDCFDGIIFYVTVTNESLDSALLNGLYVKKDNKYYCTFDYMSNELVETTDIKGDRWIGINHYNYCRIYCKSDSVSAVVPGCEFLYFSNNKTTVNFSTTGKALNNQVLETMIATFKFKE